MMQFSQSFDSEFCELIERLKGKYPDELFLLEGIHEDQLDWNKSSQAYFKRNQDKNVADKSIDPNANIGVHDVITATYETPKPFFKMNSLYNLWKILKEQHTLTYANSCIESELVGEIYINDSWDIGKPYCFNFSTYDIALEGLKMSERLNITPPKSLASFFRQVEQFVSYASNSTLGATGLADIFITASYYVDKMYTYGFDGHIHVKGTIENYIKEQIAHLIYTLNWDFFRGNQSPFTNISLYDKFFLEKLVPSYVINGHTPRVSTVQFVQHLFMEVFNEELRRTPLTFPVATACLSIDENKEIQDFAFLETVCEQNLEFAFINFYIGDTATISSCCRLRSSVNDLGYSNTFGAGSTKIGSMGVVTLNLPRLAQKSKDLPVFLTNVKAMTTNIANINHAKRTFIADRIERNALPLYTLGYMNLKHQYSTCGFTGLYEALEILGYDMNTDEGLDVASDILDAINSTNNHMSLRFNNPHNMEQVPAESSSVKLAKKDKLLGFETKYELHSNQFLPLTAKGVDLLDRIRIQGALDPYCTGGAICHLNVGNRLEQVEGLVALVAHSASQGVVYFAINYLLGRCNNNHMTAIDANNSKAPCVICGGEIEDTYTRVVGFLTNTKNWNKTRREVDLPNRVFSQAKKVDISEVLEG